MKNDQAESLKEFTDYVQMGFEPVLTEDGSFTLKQNSLDEEMHARGGAISESYFIYYEPLLSFFSACEKGDSVQVISVGTGLGYNEILAASAFFKKGLGVKVEILSYEKENTLVDLFRKRITNFKDYMFFWSTFSKIKLNPEKTCDLLKKALTVKGAFNEFELSKIKKSKKIILFDAYSNKTTQELWSEDFLIKLLNKCEKGSCFTTYAATGALNRSLRVTGFKNLKRNGFLYKRQSTLAFKESEPNL